MAASSSPHVVPLPYSDAAAVDPEEAFIASISSCHMLWFLSLAAREGYCVDRYDDAARKYLGKPASALKWGTKIEHDGVMELVTVDDAIDAFERYRADHGG